MDLDNRDSSLKAKNKKLKEKDIKINKLIEDNISLNHKIKGLEGQKIHSTSELEMLDADFKIKLRSRERELNAHIILLEEQVNDFDIFFFELLILCFK